MLVQIREFTDFSVVCTLEATSYTLAHGTNGSVNIPVDVDTKIPDYQTLGGKWIAIGTTAYFIDSVSYSDGVLSVSFKDAVYGLDFGLFYAYFTVENLQNYVASFLGEAMSVHYPKNTEVYVTFNADDIPFVEFSLEKDNDYCTAADAIEAFIGAGVVFDATIQNNTLMITATLADLSTPHNIIFDGVNNIFGSDDYSPEYTTTIRFISTPTSNGVQNELYLTKDGTYKTSSIMMYNTSAKSAAAYYTTDKDAYTIVTGGKFECKMIKGSQYTNGTGESSVATIYNKLKELCDEYEENNAANYSVEFRTKEALNLGQTVRLKVHGEVHEVTVSEITKPSTSEYYSVKCGYLNTTVKDHLRYNAKSGTLYL